METEQLLHDKTITSRKVFEEARPLRELCSSLASSLIEGVVEENVFFTSRKHPGCIIRMVKMNVADDANFILNLQKQTGIVPLLEQQKINEHLVLETEVYDFVVYRAGELPGGETYIQSITLQELMLAANEILTDENGVESLDEDSGWSMDDLWECWEVAM